MKKKKYSIYIIPEYSLLRRLKDEETKREKLKIKFFKLTEATIIILFTKSCKVYYIILRDLSRK